MILCPILQAGIDYKEKEETGHTTEDEELSDKSQSARKTFKQRSDYARIPAIDE